jgi:hypothetical protein
MFRADIEQNMSYLAWCLLSLAFFSAVVIAVDERRHPPKMAIMKFVWPITALYFCVFGLWAYFVKGRTMTNEAMQEMGARNDGSTESIEGSRSGGPTLTQTALAASHCGAGCVIADIVTESVVFAASLTLFRKELYASYLWDFVAAWLLGIVFQYFTIKPMRNLSVGAGILAAIKADTFSILSFQLGMYGWMALTTFKLFPQAPLHPNQALYWFMMQIAMVFGFLTSMPVNWLLLKTGLKERMG